jgi:hypothetical protein
MLMRQVALSTILADRYDGPGKNPFAIFRVFCHALGLQLFVGVLLAIIVVCNVEDKASLVS